MGKSPDTENPFYYISAGLSEPARVMSVTRGSLKFGDFAVTRFALDGFKYIKEDWEPGKLVIVDGYSNGRAPLSLKLVEGTDSVGIQELGACRNYGEKRIGDSWDGQYYVFSWDPDGELKRVEAGVAKYHGFFYEGVRGWRRQDTHDLEFFRANRPDYGPLDAEIERQFLHVLTRERKVLLGREIPWKIDYAAIAAEIVEKAELMEFMEAFKKSGIAVRT
ncbi:hypothetical protein HYW44_04485 [Candidatus Daviesbacteria bacterium]|nr:hypothetical protein [Candidatus Daviesbacteria bacterium]